MKGISSRGLAVIVVALVAALVVAVMSADVYAQPPNGSISGEVRQDLVGDGSCVAAGGPAVPGIPVEFVTGDGFTRVFRETDAAGAFILQAAGFGTWNVTVQPGSGWQVTSQATQPVVVTQDFPFVAGIVFCIQAVEGGGGGDEGGGSDGSGGTILPEGGAVVAPGILLTAGAGAALVVIGVLLIGLGRGRRGRR